MSTLEVFHSSTLWRGLDLHISDIIIIAVPNHYLNKKRDYISLFFTGRNDQIWTDDPFHPKEVRYQAALRPALPIYYIISSKIIH